MYKLKRPQWSIITSFWASVFMLGISVILVFFILRKPIWIELEYSMTIISALTFSFFFILLYKGVTFDKNEKYTIQWRRLETLQIPDGIDFSGVPDLGIDFGEGVLGAIVGIIVSILVAILLAIIIGVLIWVGVNLLLVGIPVLFMPLFFVYRRAIRFEVALGRRCHNNILKSVLYSIRATIVNVGWIYFVIYFGHLISMHLQEYK